MSDGVTADQPPQEGSTLVKEDTHVMTPDEPQKVTTWAEEPQAETNSASVNGDNVEEPSGDVAPSDLIAPSGDIAAPSGDVAVPSGDVASPSGDASESANGLDTQVVEDGGERVAECEQVPSNDTGNEPKPDTVTEQPNENVATSPEVVNSAAAEKEADSETLADITESSVDPDSLKEPTPETAVEQNSVPEEDGEDSGDPEGQWTDILGTGALKKKVLKKGKGVNTRPFPGCVVTVSVEGRLDDGTIVDHNKELKFTLGDGDVIQALDLAAALMEGGEVAEVYTEARFAYGDIGREPDIPKDSTITYNVELLQIDNPVNVSKLSVPEKFSLGDKKRERGNYLYSRGEYSGAINSYKKALTILEDDSTNSEADPAQLQQLMDVRVKCYSNLAASQLKIEAYDAAVKSCDSVLNIHPQNVKALFRKGKSIAAKGETTDAIALLRKAIGLEPESKILHVELSKLVNKSKKERDKAKAMYRKMLGTDNIDEPPKLVEQNSFTKWGLILGASAAVLLSVGIAAFKYKGLIPG